MNINDDLKVNGMQKVKMPKIKHISFTNYLEQMQAPFVIYVDFECLTVPISEKRGNNSEAYQEHKACGYRYKVVSSYSKRTKIYRGPGAECKLIENLLEEERKSPQNNKTRI